MYSTDTRLNRYRVNQGYGRALRKGFIYKLRRFFLGHKKRELLSYNALREKVHVENQHDIGLQTVHIDDIVGTLGRSDDFDRQFHPIRQVTKNKWESVAHAYYSGKTLPPIELIKVGGMYLVVDGNHRLSVMRLNEQDYVDAHVVELETVECLHTTSEFRALVN